MTPTFEDAFYGADSASQLPTTNINVEQNYNWTK